VGGEQIGHVAVGSVDQAADFLVDELLGGQQQRQKPQEPA
jgi:hypothetical protein